MNYLDIEGNTITITLSSASLWPRAELLTGKVEAVGPGIYKYALSFQNLQKIAAAFPGAEKPVPRNGQHILNRMRERYAKYREGLSAVRSIMGGERFPVPPNNKFIPYAHQTKIIGCTARHDELPVFADCGTGKTGSMLRAVELAIAEDPSYRGKVLISAPLSILRTSWQNDCAKFTDLRCALLWTAAANKSSRGEKVSLYDAGPKPSQAFATRTKSLIMHWNPATRVLKSKINSLDVREGTWIKYRVTRKEALVGDQWVEFGPVYGASETKLDTRSAFMQEQLSRQDVDIYIINHDGVRIYQDLLKGHGFKWVIVDESTKLKNVLAKVTQAHIDISWGARRRNILSGTPNPNGFLDLWAQYFFVDRGATLGTRLADYKHDYFQGVSVGHFGGKDAVKYIVREDRRDTLIQTIKNSAIFLDQRDCVDLPPRVDLRREVLMSDEQTKAYLEMEERLVTEVSVGQVGSVQVEAKNYLAKLMKLRQITSGFIGDSEHGLIPLGRSPKLDDLMDFLEELGDKKLVVACQFKEEIRLLLDALKEIGVCAIYGDVSMDARTEAIRKFQEEDAPRVIILQPQAAAHGITLTRAHYLCFMSLDYNFEYYYQTAKRIERIGQKSSMFVTHTLARTSDGAETIDHDLMDVLAKKSVDRDALFKDHGDLVDLANEMRSRLRDRVTKRNN